MWDLCRLNFVLRFPYWLVFPKAICVWPQVSSTPGGTISAHGEVVGKSKTIQRGAMPYKFK